MSNNKSSARQKIRYRIRKKISGTSATPRLTVFRSNSDIYVQIIDDQTATTIAAASSRQKDIAAQKAPKIDKSKMVVWDSIYVGNGEFNSGPIDLSRDPGFYPFKAEKYRLIVWVTPGQPDCAPIPWIYR